MQLPTHGKTGKEVRWVTRNIKNWADSAKYEQINNK